MSAVEPAGIGAKKAKKTEILGLLFSVFSVYSAPSWVGARVAKGDGL